MISVILTLVSFPLMLRALGAAEYGAVVYVTAVVLVLEAFADFGISSAAGKDIAGARDAEPQQVRAIIRQWARMQGISAMLGLLPMLVATVVLVRSAVQLDVVTIVLLAVAAWFTIASNFARAGLTSMLAFKRLAVLDGFESVGRSCSWIAVALWARTGFGYAVATVIVAGGVALAGCALLWDVARRQPANSGSSGRSTAAMLKESLHFLWLRFATRMFQSTPTVLFGRLVGPELVGIVASLAKVIEITNFPFSVVGTALAVRAPGIAQQGRAAALALWDTATRIVAASVMLAASLYLGAPLLAQVLLPGNADATGAYRILAVTVAAGAAAAVIAPMSDYVGALRSRNILLTLFAVLQVPVIGGGAWLFGATGALVAHVALILAMNIGYIRIALARFFADCSYRLPDVTCYFAGLVGIALIACAFAAGPFARAVGWPAWLTGAAVVATFWSAVLVGLGLYRPAQRYFLSREFLELRT